MNTIHSLNFNFICSSDGKASAYNAGVSVRSLDRKDTLEKEMATHSSTLAWKIPWMEEPGRLQAMGSKRVGHDWETSLHTIYRGLPGGSTVKYLPANVGDSGDVGLILGLRRSLGGGNGNPQYFWLRNPNPWTEETGRLQSMGLQSMCMHTKSLQSYLTLYDPRDCGPPGLSVHGILQTRTLEWVAMPSSRASSPSRDGTQVSYFGRWVLYL